MTNILQEILDKIALKNPNHAAKLLINIDDLDANYHKTANDFFNKYNEYLLKTNKTIDFGIDCYLHMIADMLEERFNFIRTGQYSNTSFDAVEKRVYGDPKIMDYHMHGLVLAQFLWFDQYDRILFFKDNLKKYNSNTNNYLEIGGGHGLYINEALNVMPEISRFEMVDISQSSLDLAMGILNTDKINYYLKNIFDFDTTQKYDFITMGEVLEHVEQPLELLQKAGDLLADNGVFYITTPINAPMIDHIYLFNNEQEIREMIYSANFEIIEEKIVISEKISAEKAAKQKVPVMYAAFLKKKLN